MQLVTTHQSKPSAAPLIKEAKMVNMSAVFISWNKIEDQHHNGPLIGYQVRSQTNSYISLSNLSYLEAKYDIMTIYS